MMIDFVFPDSKAFLPFFCTNSHMLLILPRWGLILPRIPPPTLVRYSAVTNPFLGYVRTQNTPDPTSKLHVGKMNYHLGQMDPNWAKCLK